MHIWPYWVGISFAFWPRDLHIKYELIRKSERQGGKIVKKKWKVIKLEKYEKNPKKNNKLKIQSEGNYLRERGGERGWEVKVGWLVEYEETKVKKEGVKIAV